MIDKFQAIIEQMPQKGSTAEECQRITLQNALNELGYAINGTTENDFKDTDD